MRSNTIGSALLFPLFYVLYFHRNIITYEFYMKLLCNFHLCVLFACMLTKLIPKDKVIFKHFVLLLLIYMCRWFKWGERGKSKRKIALKFTRMMCWVDVWGLRKIWYTHTRREAIIIFMWDMSCVICGHCIVLSCWCYPILDNEQSGK